MKYKAILLSFFLILMLSCNEKTQIKEQYNASLRFGWFTSLSFAGEVTGVKEFEKKFNLNLKLDPGNETTDPIKLVLAGTNTFGVISADRILAANEKGADLVIIGVVDYPLPGAFLSKKEKNIKTPKDWEGKRIGVLPGGSTDYLYRAFLKKTGIDTKKITEITVPFDLGTFIIDQYDVRPVFIFDEPVALDLKGIQYDIIEPKDYGVVFIGRCYFCKRETIEKNPEMVQAFINTMADGWTEALKNPEKAIKYLKEFAPEIDTNRELLALKKGKNYFKGYQNKVLSADMNAFKFMVSELIDLKVIQSVDLNKSLNISFVDNYFKNRKK